VGAQENSCVYIFRGATLSARHQRIGERPLLFEMSSLESTDIDDAHDWALAAALMPGVLAARAAAAQPQEAATTADVMASTTTALAAAPAEEAAPAASPPPAPPAAYSCALVTAQRLRPAAGVPPPGARLDILVSAPYLIPHIARFTPIFESFGLHAVVPPGLEERLCEEQLLAHAGVFDGAICGDDAYTARVFAAAAPRLRVVSKWGTGIDSIDRAAAAQHGVAVCNTPEAFTNPVADRRVVVRVCCRVLRRVTRALTRCISIRTHAAALWRTCCPLRAAWCPTTRR
jgi:hypothetical protein